MNIPNLEETGDKAIYWELPGREMALSLIPWELSEKWRKSPREKIL